MLSLCRHIFSRCFWRSVSNDMWTFYLLQVYHTSVSFCLNGKHQLVKNIGKSIIENILKRNHFRILAGTRPYWWINETHLFTNLTRPIIRQSTLFTCETSAGNPSGHVMFTSSVLFLIIRTALPWLRRHSSTSFKYLIWNIYVGVLGVISISRIYFACHFFHQCVFGIGFGIAVSQILQQRKIIRYLTELHVMKAILLGIFALVVCICVYFSHYIISRDPHWAVKKVNIFWVVNIHIGNLTLMIHMKPGIQLVRRSIQC